MKKLFSIFAMCIGFPVTAAADDIPGFVRGLFPSSVQAEFSNVTGTGNFFRSGKVELQSDEFDIAIQDMSIIRSDTDDVAVRVKAATIHPHIEAAPTVTFSDVKFSLDGLPVFGRDTLCAWTDRISSVDLGHVQITHPSDTGINPARYGLTNTRFRSRTSESDCTIAGLLGIQQVTASNGYGKSFDLSDIRIDGELPISVTAAERARGNSRVRLSIDSARYSHRDEVPVLGTSKVIATISSDTSSLSGLVGVLRSKSPWEGPGEPALLALQLTNALTMISADIGIQAPGFRLYAPGAVPSEAVANFSRAGLSTITGKASGAATLRYGGVATDLTASLVGIADVRLGTRFEVEPYRREKLEIAASGRNLGYHAIPNLYIDATEVEIVDTGFGSAVSRVTGVPPGRYMEEVAAQFLSGASGGAMKSIYAAMREAASFLRILSEGDPVRVSLKPAEPVRIIDVMVTALRDIGQLGDDLNISLAQLEKR